MGKDINQYEEIIIWKLNSEQWYRTKKKAELCQDKMEVSVQRN